MRTFFILAALALALARTIPAATLQITSGTGERSSNGLLHIYGDDFEIRVFGFGSGACVFCEVGVPNNIGLLWISNALATVNGLHYETGNAGGVSSTSFLEASIAASFVPTGSGIYVEPFTFTGHYRGEWVSNTVQGLPPLVDFDLIGSGFATLTTSCFQLGQQVVCSSTPIIYTFTAPVSDAPEPSMVVPLVAAAAWIRRRAKPYRATFDSVSTIFATTMSPVPTAPAAPAIVNTCIRKSACFFASSSRLLTRPFVFLASARMFSSWTSRRAVAFSSSLITRSS